MKRRDFILASGSTVLSGLVASGIQRSAIGLDFEISTPNKDPSEVDSLLIEFETLEITPKYLDEKEPVNVQAKVEVANQSKRSNKVQTSVINGRTKNLENDVDSVVVDGLNASSSISGDVTVSIDHPDIQDSYSQQIYINSGEIPDSGDLQARYDATEISATDGEGITSWADSSDNSYTLTGGSPTYETNSLNGNPIVSFDGGDDDLDNDWGTINQPFTIFIVAKLNELPTSQGNSYFWSLASGNLVGLYGSHSDDDYRVYAGGGFRYSSTDTNWHILSTLVDGANSELRVDGATVATGDAGSRDMSGFNLGSRGDRDEDFTNIDIAEVLYYPQNKSGIYSDAESYLNDKWAVY